MQPTIVVPDLQRCQPTSKVGSHAVWPGCLRIHSARLRIWLGHVKSILVRSQRCATWRMSILSFSTICRPLSVSLMTLWRYVQRMPTCWPVAEYFTRGIDNSTTRDAMPEKRCGLMQRRKRYYILPAFLHSLAANNRRISIERQLLQIFGSEDAVDSIIEIIRSHDEY